MRRAYSVSERNKRSQQSFERKHEMKTKLTLIGTMAVACAAIQLTAMPTEEETRRAEPVVQKLLASERAALRSGKKTRSEVAAAAIKLADEVKTKAEKLLLMKGAFVLYVQDGNLEKAVETMNVIKAAIPDMPPQNVTNMIETTLNGASKKVDGARLYKLLGETKADIPSYIDLPSHVESKAIAASVKERNSVASILKSMIKLPGRDCWLSATELTQGQWESVMGYNNSSVKGADLPVEMVSRDDCDTFLEMLNKTKEVQASRFEFRLPSNEEWDCAAMAGGLGGCWIKPGFFGDVLDMGWCSENSSNYLYAVATKAANAFGFYDMAGNVWEWTSQCDEKGCVCTRGGSAGNTAGISWVYKIGNRRWNPDRVGLRLAAHIRTGASSGNLGEKGSAGDEAVQRQATAGGYTWSYRVIDGGAMIVATNELCAVSPSPKGNVSIPSTLGGVKVTSIGKHAFRNCRGLTSVTIPEGVTSIGTGAFSICCELRAVKIPPSVRNIGEWAFERCYALRSVTIPPKVENIGAASFEKCQELKSVTIPAQVASIGAAAFSYCSSLKQITVDSENQSFTSIGGVLYTKDRSILLSSPKALTSVTIPKGVTAIGAWAFAGCNGLKSVIIPEGVTLIGSGAFQDCGGLASVTIPSSVKELQWWVFKNCKGLKSVTIRGERLEASKNIFEGCSNLKSIHVPAKAKSWEGMKEWHGIPLVFDAK